MLMATVGFVSAQSLQFELNGEVYEDGQTIYCNEFNPDLYEYAQEMQLHNISGDDLNVIVEREILSMPEGGSTYFCWGMCFSPTVEVSPAVFMPAGSVSGQGDLGFHFTPANETDVAIIKYYAYDERHADDRISIIIAYNTAEGINDNSYPMEMSSAYPNPASSTVHFDYTIEGNATAVVYNIVGQEVLRKDLSSNFGQMSLSVADLNDGIYFCTMLVNGRAYATQKFIVKK